MPVGDTCMRKWVICATKGCAVHGSGIFPAVAIVLFIAFVVGTSLAFIVQPMQNAIAIRVFTILIWTGATGGTAMLLMLRIVDPGTLPANAGPPDQHTADMLQQRGITGHDKYSETITREQIDEKGKTYESRYCVTCHLWRTEGASHCGECGHCVERLDHHCGATGVCIAKNNLRFFMAFLFFSGMGGSSAFAACITRIIEIKFWTPEPWSTWDPYVCLILGLLFMNCVNLLGFFGMTCINALYGETYKEQLKARANLPLDAPKTCGQLWVETCRPSSWVQCWHQVLCVELRIYVAPKKASSASAPLRKGSKNQTLMDDLVPALPAEIPADKEEV